MMDEELLLEFYEFLQASSISTVNEKELISKVIETNTDLGKKLQQLQDNSELTEYITQSQQLKRARSAVMAYLGKTSDDITKELFKLHDKNGYSLIYEQEYSPDLVFTSLKQFFQRTVPDMAKDLESRLRLSSKESLDTYVEHASHKSDSEEKSSYTPPPPPQDSVLLYTETPLARKLLDLKYGKSSKASFSSIEVEHMQIISPQRQMPARKKTPVKQDFEGNRYNFSANILHDLEPFKEYIGKIPAYMIAVKIEEENPELAKALQFRGPILKGLDDYRFFGE